MHHDLKAHPDSFELLALRKSEVQLWKNDRNYKVGDTCRFYEWCPKYVIFTGRTTVDLKINTVLESHEGLTPGWCLIAMDVPTSNICRQIAGLTGKKGLPHNPEHAETSCP